MADKHEEFLQKILSKFPSGMSFAFAYGSGIFHQKGNISKQNMLDFVFVLDNARNWHESNMYAKHHSHHYSSIKRFGSSSLVSLQDKLGAGVYYNTLVPMEGRMIKYGTISRENFLLDLNEWKWLYLAGRLHKPVQVLTERPNDDQMKSALIANLNSAVNAALLSLPEYFTKEELFLSIAGLSYAGDFRMVVGENKNKVHNIVSSNFESFQELYRPILLHSNDLHFNSSSGKYHQNQESGVILSRLMSLPRNLQLKVAQSIDGKKLEPSVIDSALVKASKDRVYCSQLLEKGVKSIVKRSSITQSVKGVVTAGGHKTLIYSAQKITKMLRGIFKR